jgi:hypothetical protein
MVTTFLGILTAIVVIILTVLLSKQFSTKLFAATTLCAIAFIYVGFSLQGNSVNSIIIEVGVALVFYFIAMIGYTTNNLIIAYGIIVHGIWDMLHHHALIIQTRIPLYWPTYCLAADLILGIYFLLRFKVQKRKII